MHAAPLQAILAAVARLDAAEAERLLAFQLAALGPGGFAERVASPFLRRVGDLWHADELAVASEHLASSLVRNLLGAVLRTRAAAAGAPPILFTTPPGEHHELGTLIAAVATMEAGGNAVYLGPDLPVKEMLNAAESLGARAVALGVAQALRETERAIRSLRAGLTGEVELWVGGPGSEELHLPPGAELVRDVAALTQRVEMLGVRGRRGPA
jgi:methanogenic corrinoid protein MtbC1